MKREDLEKLELEKEKIDSIMALHGKDIEKLKSDKQELDTQFGNLQKQFEDANKQIESFKSMDVEGIKKAADEWKAKAEQAEKDAKEQISKLKFETALDGALASAKAKNPKAVKALLEIEKLQLDDDGEILNLSKQLEKIKSENDFLFDSGDKEPKFAGKTSGDKQNLDPVVAAARKAAGLDQDKK